MKWRPCPECPIRETQSDKRIKAICQRVIRKLCNIVSAPPRFADMQLGLNVRFEIVLNCVRWQIVRQNSLSSTAPPREWKFVDHSDKTNQITHPLQPRCWGEVRQLVNISIRVNVHHRQGTYLSARDLGKQSICQGFHQSDILQNDRLRALQHDICHRGVLWNFCKCFPWCWSKNVKSFLFK